MPNLATDLARVMEKRDIAEIEKRSIPVPGPGCWLWTCGTTSGVYGAFSPRRGQMFRAHRYAYECVHGPIPRGMHVLHSCDTPLCVNPDHLRVGTQRQNSADMRSRGRSLTGQRNAQSKLDDAMVMQILAYPKGYDLTARRFGISRSVIREIRKGRAWRHVRRPEIAETFKETPNG